LLGIAVAVAFFKGSAVTSSVTDAVPSNIAPNSIDTSLRKFNIVHEFPMQKSIEIIQPQPQPHIFEPQPVQQVVRPNYPVNKIDPPAVNRTFQPMFNQQPLPQQVEMIPVQQVEKVLIQKVEWFLIKKLITSNR